MLESYRFTVCFFIWLALITFLSLYNFSDYQDVDIQIPFLDKLVHFIFYYVGTLLGCLFIRERTRGLTAIRKTSLFMGLFMILYGILIEILQAGFTVDRSGEVLDFVANLGGVILAILTVNFVFSPKTGLKWKY